MKLIIIYGPPSVGKLTVAKELAKLTRYKIFHNHLTMDLVSNFFKFGTKKFWKENRKLRNLLFDIIARNKINSIFTFAYSGEEDNITLKEIIRTIKKYGGKVYFVRLITKIKILEKRVSNKSRKKYGKLIGKEGLRKELRKNNFFTRALFKPHFEIDNTNLSAKKSANRILKFIRA